MSLNTSVRILPEPLMAEAGAVIAAGGGTPGNFVPVGTPLTEPSRLILFQNATDGDIIVSFNGVDDHMPIFNGAFILLDVSTNRSNVGGAFSVAEGTQFYARSLGGTYPIPSTGDLIITSFYGK